MEVERALDAQRVGLEELLRRSDFVTLHVPLTDESHHLMNAKTIGMMKRARSSSTPRAGRG